MKEREDDGQGLQKNKLEQFFEIGLRMKRERLDEGSGCGEGEIGVKRRDCKKKM